VKVELGDRDGQLFGHVPMIGGFGRRVMIAGADRACFGSERAVCRLTPL
jgi:hypothetical protein